MTYDTSINDPLAGGSNYSWHLTTIEAYGAWNYVKADGDVTVVVMDYGFDLDHPDLAPNLNLDDAWDAINRGPLYDDSSAESDHGTKVAGVIAACTNNGLGAAGVSYNAKVLPIRVLDASGEGSDTDITAAYEYVFDLIDAGDDSIKVVNMSFGGDGLCEDLAAAIESAVDDYGLTLVASAGNAGSSGAHYPSDDENCISVIALGWNLGKAWFSNYGSGTDVSAPGVDIYSTAANNSYISDEGTSFAAPIVSGVAALLYAADPDATPQEVEVAIIGGAVDLGTPGFDNETAHGMVNAENAVEMLLFGNYFDDVVTSDWYVMEGHFTYALTHGLMKGYNGTHEFRPSSNITRAEFATVLYRMANPNSQATTNPAYFEDDTTGFTDAVDGEYFTAAINWAKTTGIMVGDSVTNYTTVRPNDPLNRQEAAVMAQRFAGVVGVSTGVAGMAIPDVNDWTDVEGWAQDAMKWCNHYGVITGWTNEDGSLSALPLGEVTRSMMTKIATTLHRDVMP